jgi:hypothetical protein
VTDREGPQAEVGRAAFALGVAGLLPQVAAVALMLLARRGASDMSWILLYGGYFIALGYGALILSFLGGIWWGFAMRRDEGQGRLAGLAVVPSLVGAAALLSAAGGLPARLSGWPAVVLGSAILLTLPIDRYLAGRGEAPHGWMRLRVPLSVGLGGLTILAGALV